MSRKPVPIYHPKKPEALVLQDFGLVEFELGKPAILRDFVWYMTGKNLSELLRLIPVVHNLTRKKSEEMIKDAELNSSSYHHFLKHPNYNYFLVLQNEM
jgi:hypothetical protein